MKLARAGLGALLATAALYATGASAAVGAKQPSKAQQSSSTKAAHSSKPRTASGDVKAIDGKALTFSDGEQFRLTKSTQFDRAGKGIRWKDVKPGEHVKASYEPRGNLAYADRIDVVSSQKSGRSSAKQEGTGSTASSSSGKKP